MKTQAGVVAQQEREIINKALAFEGLISDAEYWFIRKIANWPSHYRLTVAQANWLYDIGEKKLIMGPFERLSRPLPIDYRARACA